MPLKRALPNRTAVLIAAAAVLAWFTAFPQPRIGSNGASAAGVSDRCPSVSGQTVVQTVRLPGSPGDLLLRGNTLWVAIDVPPPGLDGRGAVVGIDARSGRVRKVIRLPVNPYRLAIGFGSLWVTGETNVRRYRGVLRIDRTSGRVLRVIRGRKTLGAALVTTSDFVWVGGGDVFPEGHPELSGVRFVYKIDPRRNAVVSRVQLSSTTVIDLLGERRSLWATGWGGVVRLSQSGRVLRGQRFGGSGWALTRTSGAVWVAQPWFGSRRERRQDRPARRLLKVTTEGPPRLRAIELDSQPGDVSAAGDAVWIGTASLGRLEAAADAPTVAEVPVNLVPNRIEAFRGGAWVSERGKHRLSKVC
jgi:hypothetical protein